MKRLNTDRYRICEPLFEGVRVIMSFLGESYSPAYIQGVSGAAFRVAGICPCAPTCSCMMWTSDLIRLLGYEIREYNLSADPPVPVEELIQAVREEIDAGRPALVWHAFTNYEWDVVCGYDEEKGAFLGRGSYTGLDDYASESWYRGVRAAEVCPAFGAITIGSRISAFDASAAEAAAIREAVRHGLETNEPAAGSSWTMLQGIQCYRRWADDFAKPGKDRGAGDAYCYGIYSFTHEAAAAFLREIAGKYGDASAHLLGAAGWFEKETNILKTAEDLLSWSSPWGVDEERSKKAAPILKACADAYEQAILCLEKALPLL